MPMTHRPTLTATSTEALAAAREQLRHTIERLDEARADLEATAAGLRLPEREGDIDGPLAGICELDAVIRCDVHDRLKPLLASLRSLLHDNEEPKDE
ncbi:MAG TPA: hypothetical protein VEW48_22715 [Thermoanaerobaculia bacterium]|nr:hypothetical protein [Thermoanaerobaculia bacterium]